MKHFENIIGYEHIKYELEKIIDCINNKDKYEKLGVKAPKNLFLYGAPGIGKTLFAKSFVNSLNRNKYIIRKNKPDGEFVNEINKIITEAMSNTPSVVLLDDLDKFSNNDEIHPNSDEFIVIQSFIDECKDKDVYFVATANYIREMPPSLLRPGRFATKIEVESPTLKDAEAIIKHYLSDKCVDKNIDYEEIARILNGGTCALLEDVINEAGLIAGFNNKAIITMDDIIKASLRVIYDAPENFADKTKYQIEMAAYHEAGHAISAEVLEKGSVNLVSIANYFGNKGGITSQTNNENYWFDFNMMENRIVVLLAGKAATEVMLGKNDTGCYNDLSRARRILERFYDDFGLASFKVTSRESGPSVLNHKDEWISQKLDEYYQKTKYLLINNKEKFDKLTNYLIDNKTIIRKDIAALLYKEELNND